MIRIKICGITNQEDALKAAELGAWALGFIFYKKSPRYISPYKAKKIIEELPPFISPVGVFVNQSEGALKDIADFCGIRTIQLHGEETPLSCRRLRAYKIIKAFRINEGFDFNDLPKFSVAAFLFDTHQDNAYGGSGKVFNWELLKNLKTNKPVILSGGLNPDNIASALRAVHPYAVDVSSGVEKSPGKKDERLLQDFFSAIRKPTAS